MKAKEYFSRARNAEQELKRLDAMRQHYIDVGLNITSKWGNTPPSGSSNSSKVESAVIGIVSAEQGVLDEIEAYKKIVLEANRVISMVQQSRFRQILTLHYLAGQSLAQVGEKLRYTDRNSIYRAHGWALAEAQKILDRLGKEE